MWKITQISLVGFFFLSGCASRVPQVPAPKGTIKESPGEAVIERSEIPRVPSLSHEHVAVARFDWPVDEARLTRGFLPKKRKPHLGLDLAAKRGTPIYASIKGRVIYVGNDFRGYGKMILVETGDQWATLYAHLDRIFVSEGQKVQQGDFIAKMGRTGRATGPHLHFEIRYQKLPVNPILHLPKSYDTTSGQSVSFYDRKQIPEFSFPY